MNAARLQALATLLLLAAVGPVFAGELDVEVRDLAGNALQDAVIFLEPTAGMRPPAQAPKTTIDQVNKEFVPLVTVIEAGTEVSFPNSDNIRHSIYSFSPAKVFTTKLYSGKQAPPVIFDKPGLVVLGCNIHDHMIAWVVVVDTPYFSKTGADGLGAIKGLGPGDYRLSLWYPAAQFEPHVEQIHLGAEPSQRRLIKLDASGSPLPAAHHSP